MLDEGLLIWMRGPRSFTGEDVVEFHCHGNPWILERLVNAAMVRGARAAEPGEFTRRAYLNGRIDLIQADAVMQIISASSDRGLKAARRLLSGELSRRIESLQTKLVDVLKWLEMAIDFPEEDIEPASEAQMSMTLWNVSTELHTLIKSFRRGHRARQGARVVLCGRANVGKSSLFNALLGFRRSIVADIPGTTRDLVEASIELGGLCFYLQDTAGLRDTLDVLESQGIDMARDAIQGADLLLLVVDGSTAMTSEDEKALHAVKDSGLGWLGVLNKCDQGSALEWAAMEGSWVPVSAQSNEGISRLQDLLLETMVGAEEGEELLLTSRWQKEVLERLLGNVETARSVMLSGLSPEATAFELYEALDRIDEIRGGSGRTDVMNRVFAEFCLGK